MKSVFAVLVMAAIASVAPKAHAQNVKVLLAGASGSWAAVGVGTWKGGACPTGALGGCAHYSYATPSGSSVKFLLNDGRPAHKLGTTQSDSGSIWIVWDNTTANPTCDPTVSTPACNVWAYIKVDSVVGVRCYFAQPHCNVTVNAAFPAPNAAISVWGGGGAETTPPATIEALFTTGTNINAAASEVRPEDALFATCRANSVLGGDNDGLKGLGYGINPSGTCPTTLDLAHLQGTDLTSAYPSSTGSAHVLAFNLSGTDPFTGIAIPAASTINLGVEPIVLIANSTGALAGVSNATLSQIQTAFSGAKCSGDVFAGGAATPIAVYQREPLSGTMNTFEYTAARLPRDSGGLYPLPSGSQENLIGGANPAGPVACTAGGGSKYRPIGSSEEVKFVLNSNSLNGMDGIGYTFFSYSNVSSIADNANYSYFTVDGIDPLWQVYGPKYDPAQNATGGTLPGTGDLPVGCAGAFPCAEKLMWKGGLSYPNVRSGAYRLWAVVRLISNGTPLTALRALATSAGASAVNVVPDFIPYAASGTDPGFKLLRSHYTQAGKAPVNAPTEAGGDEGGCILPASTLNPGATKLVQRNVGCVAGP